MEKLREILTRKLGPLPAWAWGALGVGGLAVYRYRRAATGGGTAFEPSAPPEMPEAPASYDMGFVPVSPVYGSVASPGSELALPPGGATDTSFHPGSAIEFRRGLLTGRIWELQRGGATQAERHRIQLLRARRRALRAG